MIDKPLQEITAADIRALVDGEVQENERLEYKEELPGGKDRDKVEFYADVSAFANTAGGDVLYGVRERPDATGNGRGTPDPAAIGLTGFNPDKDVLRLETMIRSGIEPRIPGIAFHTVASLPNGPVLIVRVPRSWAAPHMVTLNSRFYGRGSRGKYELGVREIRAAVLQSEGIIERARKFRVDRLAAITAGEAPARLAPGGLAVLHVLSLASMDSGGAMRPDFLQLRGKVEPLYGGGNFRVNFDGLLIVNPLPSGVAGGYVQVFRTGIVEAVDQQIIGPRMSHLPEFMVRPVVLESALVASVRQYLGALRTMLLPAPAVVVLSLAGVKGAVIPRGREWYDSNRIDRDLLLFPEVLVEDLTADVPRLLRPVFDALHQSGGFEGCPHYDDQGNWSVD